MLFGADYIVHLIVLASTFANVASQIIEQAPDCRLPPPQCSVQFNKSTPMAQRRCDKPGVLLMPTDEADAPVAACTAQSYSECQRVCKSSVRFGGAPGASCHSFGFDSDTGRCTTSQQNPQQQAFVRDDLSTTSYTAGRCFTATYLLTYPEGRVGYPFGGTFQGQRIEVTGFTMQEELDPIHGTNQCDVVQSCIDAVMATRGYSADNGALVVAYDKTISAYRCSAYQGQGGLVREIVDDPDYVVSYYYAGNQQD